jgi:hypothetical protein
LLKSPERIVSCADVSDAETENLLKQLEFLQAQLKSKDIAHSQLISEVIKYKEENISLRTNLNYMLQIK